MWIDDEANEHHLRTWLKHCPAMKLVSTLDGKILWANAAFCDWSQYTLGELRKLTWMQISVPDKSLESDIDESKNLDAYNPTYSVKKQYIPKGSKPEWGQLTVMRYPLSGEIECCLCTWEPLKNGTATAFAMAMEHCQKIDARLEQMTAEMKMITSQTDEDKFVLGAIRMIQRYPKIAAGFLVVALSIFGANNVLALLQRTGVVTLPVKIETVNE
jgi:PAS domain S-box-containing protein